MLVLIESTHSQRTIRKKYVEAIKECGLKIVFAQCKQNMVDEDLKNLVVRINNVEDLFKLHDKLNQELIITEMYDQEDFKAETEIEHIDYIIEIYDYCRD